MAETTQKFTFDNYGGTYQLRIRTAEDLRALEILDEPFWVATSAPVDQLRSDPELLKRLDRDGDGRILSSDIRAAALWLLHVLSNREGVDQCRDVLRLDDIDTSHDEGRLLREAAEQVLSNIGHSDAGGVKLDAVRDRESIVAKGDRNGDGVIPPSSAPDDALRTFIHDVIETTGSVQDLNGEPGVNEQLLDQFLADAGALMYWRQQRGEQASSDMFPLDEDTAAGYVLVEGLRGPIEKYFELCRVVGLNRVLDRETKQPESPPEVFRDDEAREQYLREAPIARPRPEPVLPFEEDVNPEYADRLRSLRDTVAQRILGQDFNPSSLSKDDWKKIRNAFSTYEEWLKSKKGGAVEKLGPEKLSQYIAGDLPNRLREMIKKDKEVRPQVGAMRNLEYLILLQRWILEICNNFVSFPYLYDPDHHATFEEGRLVMDGKIFKLNMRIENVDEHSKHADRSGIHLLYSEVTHGEPQKKFHIVTPVAHVDLGNLDVDKRGVLFDLNGCEWDVKVVKVVENVVSLKQAILEPFRRIGRYIKDTMAKLSGAAEQHVQQTVTQEAKSTAATGQPPAQAAAPARSTSPLRDIVLAGGLSVAALGTSFAYIGASLKDPDTVLRVLGVIGVVILILLIPVAIYALYKLYIRNLSSLLEASGWAINARMRLTFAVAKVICYRPERPKRRFRISHRDIVRVLSHKREHRVDLKPQNEE